MQRQNSIGIILPTRNVVTGDDSPQAALRAMVSCAQFLDDLGFGSVWVGDSLLGRPRPEPLAVLAAIGIQTKRIQVGTAALLPAMRNPLQLAQQAATVDLLSDGRLTLGVGTGFPNDQTRRELEALGIPFKERIERCHEAVAWCRSIWGAKVPDRQKYWKFDGIDVPPLPAQENGPPFWLGGTSDKTCRIAGRDYQGWMPTSPTPQSFAQGWQIVRESALAAGRDPNAIARSTVLTLAVDQSGDEARATLRRFMETYYKVPLEEARKVVGCSAGTVEEVAVDLRQFVDVGVQHFLIRFAAPDQTEAIQHWAPLLLEMFHKLMPTEP